jgi:protein-tyrosine phosphatase
MNVPIECSYQVEKDKFYAGEYPRCLDDNESLQKIDRFIQFGITDFINLTAVNGDGRGLKPYEQLLPDGVRSHHFPIGDYTFPQSFEELHRILTTIDEHIKNGSKVYVHCFAGVDRTGVIVACWFAYHGMSAAEAMKEYKQRWKTNPKLKEIYWTPLIQHKPEYIGEYIDWLKYKEHSGCYELPDPSRNRKMTVF